MRIIKCWTDTKYMSNSFGENRRDEIERRRYKERRNRGEETKTIKCLGEKYFKGKIE